MTELDDELIPVAFDLVADFGKAVTYRTYPSQTIDATTSETTLGAAVDYAVNVQPLVESRKALWKETDPIQSRETFTTMLPTGFGTADAIAFTPVEDEAHLVIVDGIPMVVMKVKPLYSGASIYGFELEIAA